jgi:hypothetical protein
MSLIDRFAKLERLAFCAILLWAAVLAGPTSAQGIVNGGPLLVLHSTVSDLPSGQMVDASRLINLSAGQSVVLVDDAGATRRLTGPLRGRAGDQPVTEAASGSQGVVAVFRALLGQREQLEMVLRSGQAAKPPSAWLVSIHGQGPVCVPHDRVTFWRAEASEDARLSVDLGIRKANAAWAKGTDRVAIPSQLFKTGQTYRAQLGEDSPREFIVHIAPAAAGTPVGQAMWMVSMGCKPQALSLLDQMK